jgi:hypothetical protein
MLTYVRRCVPVLCLVLSFSLALYGSAQKPKLSLANVEQLIQLPGPDMDESLASAIRSRGLGFTLTRKTMDKLAAKAKGKPHSLAALRELVVLSKGSVEVHTEPRALIILDGKEFGFADAGGLFDSQNVFEGDHELLCRSAGYRDAGSKFSMDSNEAKKFTFPLEWIGGYLSVSASPADAKIAVSGPRSSYGSLTDAKFPTGSYTATVSSDYYQPQTRHFQIVAGEHHVEHFQLAMDIEAAKAKADAGDQAALNALFQALEGGYEVDCKVKATGNDYATGVTINETYIKVSRTAVKLFQDLTVSPQKILEVTYPAKDDNSDTPGLFIKVATMNKKGTKENKRNYQFYNQGAAFVVVGNSGPMRLVRIACNGCDNSLNVLFELIQKVRGVQ